MDEINLIFRPEIIGGFETPSLFASPELKPDEWPARLRPISVQARTEGYVWLRYETLTNQ